MGEVGKVSACSEFGKLGNTRNKVNCMKGRIACLQVCRQLGWVVAMAGSHPSMGVGRHTTQAGQLVYTQQKSCWEIFVWVVVSVEEKQGMNQAGEGYIRVGEEAALLHKEQSRMCGWWYI